MKKQPRRIFAMTRREWIFCSVWILFSLAVVGVKLNFWGVDLSWRDAPPTPVVWPSQYAESDTTLVLLLAEQEGFRGVTYRDGGGNLTIGYGTKLPLTKQEGRLLLQSRLDDAQHELAARWPTYLEEPPHIQQALSLMAYQLGVAGELRFERFLAALQRGDIDRAVDELHDSRWNHQTPERVDKVVELLTK